MVRYLILVCFAWLGNFSFAQNFILHNGIISIQKNTSFNFYNTNLSINGGYIDGKKATSINIKNTENTYALQGLGAILADSINFFGNCNASVFVKANVVKITNGEISFNHKTLVVIDEIKKETDSAYFNEVILKHRFKADTARVLPLANFGLTIQFSDTTDSLWLERKNVTHFIDDKYSINQFFSLPDSILPIEKLKYHFTESNLQGLNPELLEVYASNDLKTWFALPSVNHWPNQKSISADVPKKAKYFTLFERNVVPELFIPNGFSPNNDGINETFEIKGIENYPNNKLVILNAQGAILFEAQPYINNFTGTIAETKLTTGTYLYLFFKDAGFPNDVTKGFIELRAGR